MSAPSSTRAERAALALALLCAGVAAGGCKKELAPAGEPVRVAAAADLAFAFKDVGEAIVALSLATVTEGGAYTPIDPATHERIEQALVACKGKRDRPRDEARAFGAFVGSDDGRAIMRRFGFLLPGEQTASSAR